MTDYDNPITVIPPNQDKVKLTREFSELAKETSTLETIDVTNITEWLLNKGERDFGATSQLRTNQWNLGRHQN